MIKTRLTERVRHSPDDLLFMVTNVESYPDFIPFITDLRVTERSGDPEDVETFSAQLRLEYKMISEQFGSNIQIDHPNRQVTVRDNGDAGPVKTLVNHWRFYELSDGSSLVDFYIEVSLKAFPLEILLKGKFDEAAAKVMDVFRARADAEFPMVGAEDFDFADEARQLIS